VGERGCLFLQLHFFLHPVVKRRQSVAPLVFRGPDALLALEVLLSLVRFAWEEKGENRKKWRAPIELTWRAPPWVARKPKTERFLG
jgi:hypothetical protein